MIEIHMTGNRIRIRGHSGYAPPGQDIVCAAVSALTDTLAASLEELTADVDQIDLRSGEAVITLNNGISEKGRALVDAFFIGISGIAEAHPDYVHLAGVEPETREG